LPVVVPASGEFLSSQFQSTFATVTPVVGAMYPSPVWVPEALSFNAISLNVSSGVASAVFRLGVYSSTSNYKPGTLLFDAGTVAATTTGIKTASITQTFGPGLFWLVAVAQTAAAGRYGYAINTHSLAAFPTGTGTGFEHTPGQNFWIVGSVTGALPASPTWAFQGNQGSSVPIVWLTVA
jgi:hypothetical protein